MNQWKTDLPSQPDLGSYKEDPTYTETAKLLHNLHFYINLFMEDLLYHYELSPVKTELALTLISYSDPTCCRDYLLFYLLFTGDKMWRVEIHKHVKKSQQSPEQTPTTKDSTPIEVTPTSAKVDTEELPPAEPSTPQLSPLRS